MLSEYVQDRMPQAHFEAFLESVKKRYRDKSKPASSVFKKITLPLQGQGIEFQKGFFMANEKFYYMSDDLRRNFINILDLPSRNHSAVRIHERVHGLFGHHEDQVFFSVTRQNPYKNPRFLRVLTQGEVIEKELDDNPDYFFQTKKGGYYFSYKNNRWHFYKEGREKHLLQLEELEDIQSPFLFEGKIFFKSVALKGAQAFFIKAVDLDTGKLVRDFSLKRAFSINGRCDNSLFISDDKDDYIYDIQDSSLAKIEGDRPVAVVQGGASSLWFFEKDPLHAYYASSSCKNVINATFKKSSPPSAATPPSLATAGKNKGVESDYRGIKYLTPTLWLFSFGLENTYQLYTLLSDPVGLHSVGLNALYYGNLKEWGGAVSYERDWEYFVSVIGLKREFSLYKEIRDSQSTDKGRLREEYSLSFLKPFETGGWRFRTGPGIFRKKEAGTIKDDPYSAWEYALINSLSYSPPVVDAAIGSFLLSTRIFKREIGKTASHGREAGMFFDWHPFFYWHLYLEGSYGKLDEKGFDDNFNLDGYHSTYSFKSDDAVGKTISTQRAMLNWRALDIFRGWKLYPIKLNTIHLFSGVERIEADALSSKGEPLNSTIYATGFFGGTTLRWMLAYSIPANLNIFFTKNDMPGSDVESHVTFDIGGAF